MGSVDSFGAKGTLRSETSPTRSSGSPRSRAARPSRSASRCCSRTCCAPRTAPTSRPTTSAPLGGWDAERRARHRDPVHAGPRDHAGLHRRARASSTSPPCARRSPTSAATRRRSTRSRRPSWSSTTPSSPTCSAARTRFERNVEIEYERNGERYQFLRWGQTAFDDFKVVPPGTGIVHQVNIEHLARVVMTARSTASCSPTPTPASAPTPTPRWSTASACSAGASAASRPRRPCSASPSRCSSRASSASS